MKPKQKPDAAFRALDCLYLALIFLPLVIGMLVANVDHPFSTEISITGARILWRSEGKILFDCLSLGIGVILLARHCRKTAEIEFDIDHDLFICRLKALPEGENDIIGSKDLMLLAVSIPFEDLFFEQFYN